MMTIDDGYHDGELALQARAGKLEDGSRIRRAIRDHIPDGAGDFIEQQSMAVLGSMDRHGQIWASVLFGRPGFLHAADPRRLEIDLRKAKVNPGDPLWENINPAGDMGLLLIDFASRHRFRINGRAHKVSHEYYVLEVVQAYGNCPKYIQRRQLTKAVAAGHEDDGVTRHGEQLDAELTSLIESSDTFFVASAHPERGVDASHRGGHPGFVQVLNDRLLRIPDYPGNNMFNTLGNFYSYPRAGLVFIDFQRNRLLQLSGEAEILWDVENTHHSTAGTRRYWQLDIRNWQLSPVPLSLDWAFIDYSPFNP